MNNTRYLLLLPFLFTALLSGQSFTGLNVDNYGGVHSLLLNPANVAGSRTAFEINLASVSGFLHNDYAEIDGMQVPDALSDDFSSAVRARTPGDENNLFINADAIGPSLLISLGKTTGIAFMTRARVLYTTEGINGRLFEGLQDNFGSFGNFDFDQRDHRSVLHGWAEASVVLGTTLINEETIVLKAGGALKYLQGAGVVYTHGDRLSGSYSAETDRVNLAGDITIGRANDFYVDDGYELSDPSTGLAFDAGVVLEWRPTQPKGRQLGRTYKLKLAASLVDVGGINYDVGEEVAYTLSGSVPAGNVEGGDTEFALENNFEGSARPIDARVSLPTALHLQVDYRLAGSLYVGALYSTAFGADAEELGNRVPSSLTLFPRVETKGLSFYAPVSFRDGRSPVVGAGLRMGLLHIGSSSAVSHLLGDGGYTLDVYAGVKLAFNRRSRMRLQDYEARQRAAGTQP